MRIGTATCFRNKDFEGSTPLPSTIIEFQSYGFESRRGHIKIKLAYGRLPEIGLSGSPAKGCGVTATWVRIPHLPLTFLYSCYI